MDGCQLPGIIAHVETNTLRVEVAIRIDGVVHHSSGRIVMSGLEVAES